MNTWICYTTRYMGISCFKVNHCDKSKKKKKERKKRKDWTSLVAEAMSLYANLRLQMRMHNGDGNTPELAIVTSCLRAMEPRLW